MMLLVLVFLLSDVSLQAQVAGTISGFVRDQTGALIPGAEVTAEMVDRPVARTAVTGATGIYDLLAMPPGIYHLKAEMPGFKTQVHERVELTAGANLRLDFSLAIGEVTETVTVEAPPVMVEARSETHSGLIDDRRVTDLPLYGRNVVGLAGLHAGITDVRADQDTVDTRSGPAMAVHGSNRNQNLFTLNNAAFMQFNQTTGLNPPPPDAVEEVRILTHNFAAEFGQTGGSQVSIVTRAGTNEFHGALWNFHRNSALDARSFFQSRRPGRRQNQAGGSAGGPIFKEKLFAFGSYQRLWDRREAGSSVVFVPTDAERAGDFTQSGVELDNPIDILTGQPFTNSQGQPCVVGNVIHPDCISPVAKILLDRYIPRSPDGVINNIQTLKPAPRNNENWIFRMDYIVSNANQMHLHFYADESWRSEWPGNMNFLRLDRFSNAYQASLHDTHTFSQSLINEATFAYIRAKGGGDPSEKIHPRDLGINMEVGLDDRGPSLSVTGGPSIDYPGVQKDKYYSWEIKNNMTWIVGNHTVKWGYNVIRPVYDFNLYLTRSISFTGNRTGLAMADFMLGAFDTASMEYGRAVHDPESYKHNLFIQDTFRIHPRVSLNYGLRWEPFISYDQKSGYHTSWQPGVQSIVVPDAPEGILFPGDPGLPRKLTHNDLNNFAPRLGFAWDVTGDARTVVRGGYGIFYQQVQGETTHASEAPWRTASYPRNGRVEDPFGSVGMDHPPIESPGIFGCSKIDEWPGLRCTEYPLPLRFVYTDPYLVTPYMQHFNLSIQRQIGRDWVIENSYIGKTAKKLVGHNYFNAARPIPSPFTGEPPSIANIDERVPYYPGVISPASRVLGNFFDSWYHSYQLKVERRFSSGFSILGSYVLAKNLTTQPEDTLGQISVIPNPFNLRTLKGPSLLDRRHVAVVSWVWTPQPRFDNLFLDKFLRDWTITGLWRAQTGTPLTFTMGRDVAAVGTLNTSSQYAQLVPGVTVDDIKLEHDNRHDMHMRYFNTDAFVDPRDVPVGTFGNTGRGLIYGPGRTTTDISLLREIVLAEPVRVQLRGEFFNVFNRPNFSNPNTNSGSSSFGRITGADSGRTIQIAAKVIW